MFSVWKVKVIRPVTLTLTLTLTLSWLIQNVYYCRYLGYMGDKIDAVSVFPFSQIISDRSHQNISVSSLRFWNVVQKYVGLG